MDDMHGQERDRHKIVIVRVPLSALEASTADDDNTAFVVIVDDEVAPSPPFSAWDDAMDVVRELVQAHKWTVDLYERGGERFVSTFVPPRED